MINNVGAAINQGDKLGSLITWGINQTVRSMTIRAQQTWQSFPKLFPRSKNASYRAKLVGVNAGLPDETTVYEISPTKINPFELTNTPSYDLTFRFNTPVTSGSQMYLVVYTENFTASVDLTAGSGEEFLWYGTAAGGKSAYYYGGVWIAGSTDFEWRAFDYFAEPVRTPDMFPFKKFDTNQTTTYSGSMNGLQLEYNTAQSHLLLSYTFGASWQNDAAQYPNNRQICYRTLSIPSANTLWRTSIVQPKLFTWVTTRQCSTIISTSM